MKRIIAALAVLCFSGCVVVNLTDYGAVKPIGDREIFEFKVGEYSGIKIEGICEIHYYNSRTASDTVILEVESNLREYYAIEVIQDELVVRTTRRINFSGGKSAVLTVSTPTLNRLTIDGFGGCFGDNENEYTFTAFDKITADSLAVVIRGAGSSKAELDVKNLSAEISGAGNFKLSGIADTADLSLSGAGELDALSLRVRDATVSLSGAGTLKVNSSEILRIDASGAGTVEYKGSPSLYINKNGVVDVKQIN